MSIAAAAGALALSCSIAGVAEADRPGASGVTTRSYVAGVAGVGDDLNNEKLIGQGNVSDYVALWQLVLYTEGHLERNEVDCVFGWKTKEATEAFQRDHGLNDDGVVFRDTLEAAGELIDSEPAPDPVDNTPGDRKDKVRYITIDGEKRSYKGFIRDSNGAWVHRASGKKVWNTKATFGGC